MQKCKFWAFFKSILFYSKKALFSFQNFTLLFHDPYWIKTIAEKILIFKQKPATNPFGKMQTLEPFQIDLFIVQKFFIFFLELHRMPFLDKFCLKKKTCKNLNFWKKPWTNPLGKMRIWGLYKIAIIQV